MHLLPKLHKSNDFFKRPSEIVIFIIGGATYEEAKEINLKNKNSDKIRYILGGTYIHNSKT